MSIIRDVQEEISRLAEGVACFDLQRVRGAVKVHKYAATTWICDCETNVRAYVETTHREKVQVWKQNHPQAGHYISFENLGITVWKATFTDSELGRHKTVYAETFKGVIITLAKWVTEVVLEGV